MKTKQKILLSVAVIIAAAIAIFAVWYFFPVSFLRDIELSDVKSITIIDGRTGNEFVVEDRTEIEHIVKNIQSVTMHKESISEGKKGWHFSMEFYDGDGNKLERFYVNSKSTIDKRPYYYCSYSKDGGLCFEYLKELTKKYSRLQQ